MSDKWKNVLINGVLKWGIPSGMLFTIAMHYINGSNILTQLPITLIVFSIGGIFFGLFAWKSKPDKSIESLEIEDSNNIIEVETKYMIWLGWFGTVFFGSMAVLSIIVNIYLAAIANLLIISLFIYLLKFSGQIHITSEYIIIKNKFGNNKLNWNDVQKYQVDQQESTYVLFTEQGYLPVPYPMWWSGSNTSEAKKIFFNMLESKNIKKEKTQLVYLKLWPKNITKTER